MAEDSAKGLQLSHRGRFKEEISHTLPGQVSELSRTSFSSFIKMEILVYESWGTVGNK